MIKQPYLFDNPANFNLVRTALENGVGKLQLVDNPGQVFEQDFSDSSGFTFDSDLVEFVSGQAEQKDQTPANSQVAATYNSSLDLSWSKDGSLAHTKVGSPVLDAGKLSTPAGNNAVTYTNAAISSLGQTGTVKFKFTPQYSGSPSANTNIFQLDLPLLRGQTRGLSIF